MTEKEIWRWTFLGFESDEEGRPVQEFYNRIPDEEKDEIRYLLVYLQNATRTLWRRPEFDPLEGAGGISEIIVPDIRHEEGVAYYRFYGYFGPGEREYTFLHATNKKVRNDIHGKEIARKRLQQIERGEAGVHKFDFEKGPPKEIT